MFPYSLWINNVNISGYHKEIWNGNGLRHHLRNSVWIPYFQEFEACRGNFMIKLPPIEISGCYLWKEPDFTWYEHSNEKFVGRLHTLSVCYNGGSCFWLLLVVKKDEWEGYDKVGVWKCRSWCFGCRLKVWWRWRVSSGDGGVGGWAFLKRRRGGSGDDNGFGGEWERKRLINDITAILFFFCVFFSSFRCHLMLHSQHSHTASLL